MNHDLDVGALRAQNEYYRGTGGTSAENRPFGFQPAFLDTDTGEIHRARFGDGRPAPFHILDGLPAWLVRERDAACGRVIAVKASIVAGFLWQDQFLTRDQAARALAA